MDGISYKIKMILWVVLFLCLKESHNFLFVVERYGAQTVMCSFGSWGWQCNQDCHYCRTPNGIGNTVISGACDRFDGRKCFAVPQECIDSEHRHHMYRPSGTECAEYQFPDYPNRTIRNQCRGSCILGCYVENATCIYQTCDAGYLNPPLCDIECPLGKFDVNCMGTCHCLGRCDYQDGTCLDNAADCEAGWTNPPHCQTKIRSYETDKADHPEISAPGSGDPYETDKADHPEISAPGSEDLHLNVVIPIAIVLIVVSLGVIVLKNIKTGHFWRSDDTETLVSDSPSSVWHPMSSGSTTGRSPIVPFGQIFAEVPGPSDRYPNNTADGHITPSSSSVSTITGGSWFEQVYDQIPPEHFEQHTLLTSL